MVKIEIEELDEKGRGIGRYKNKKVYVYFALPGDVVKVRIVGKRKNFLKGEILEVVSESDLRTKPLCKHFGKCGGCKLQNMKYDNQLEFKANIVKSAFGLDEVSIIGSKNIFFYRNRMDYITYKQKIGLREPEKFYAVVDIERCYLLSEFANKVISRFRDFIKEYGISTYDLIKKVGFLRYLIIRHAKNTDEKMINILTSKGDFPHIEKISEMFDAESIIWSTTDSIADVSYGEPKMVIKGRGFIFEKILDRKFRIGPFSFFQTNTKQAEVLFKKVIELADLKSNENVVDLYCGSGVIGILLSEYARRVIGVEVNEESINLAKENAKDIDNITFIKARVEDVAENKILRNADVVVVDPPRAGLHKNVVEALLKISPKKIIYVSCNPKTQARDYALLRKKYNLEYITAIDMFPHTPHVETVALLTKTKK